MKTISRNLSLALLLFILTPSLALAAWWNPLTWFNNWNFKKNDVQMQVATNPIQESESTKNFIAYENAPVVTTPKASKNVQAIPMKKSLSPNEVRCKINTEKDIQKGTTIEAELTALTLGISRYDINWDKKYLTKIIDYNQASFTFKSIGPVEVFANVTRKEDGASSKIVCVDTVIECNNYSCLNETDKKKYKLGQIITEVNSWYNSDYPNLSPVDQCLISESIIRAWEYEYVLMGGINLPIFSKNQDCSNVVAPKAYQYKVQLLQDSL